MTTKRQTDAALAALRRNGARTLLPLLVCTVIALLLVAPLASAAPPPLSQPLLQLLDEAGQSPNTAGRAG